MFHFRPWIKTPRQAGARGGGWIVPSCDATVARGTGMSAQEQICGIAMHAEELRTGEVTWPDAGDPMAHLRLAGRGSCGRPAHADGQLVDAPWPSAISKGKTHCRWDAGD